MTEVAFHFNLPDKLAYSCRLLRKAYAGGARVVVTAEPNVLAQLDQMLWTFSALEFVPHCRTDADAATLAATTVLLAESVADGASAEVLLNLGQSIPDGFERFARCIEVVSQLDEDRAAARRRWRHYADRGYALKGHDRAATGERS